MIKIPYASVPGPVLLRWSKKISGISNKIKSFFPNLSNDLKYSEIEANANEYIGMCLIASGMIFFFMFLLFFFTLGNFGFSGFVMYSALISLIITLFIFVQQIFYPRLIVQKRVRSIEQNLMPALQNILIQINSGVPLFDTLVNISFGGYGEVSLEFKKAVTRIAAGEDEVTAIEGLATRNSSVFLRRSIWQLVNGMKAGSEIKKVLENIIQNLSEEQIISIQKYGSQLNPLAMFYMLIAVILPSLGITFIIVLSSFIALSESVVKIIFYSLSGVVIFFQLMFIGVIKARRPTLMQ